MTSKIIFLGLDGATWEQFDYYLKEGLMPNLSFIINNGIRGNLKSYFPYSSKSAWTCMLTGTNPGKHGVPHHGLKEPQEVPSVWELISDSNVKSIIVHEMLTYPPQKINGIMITGGMSTPPLSKNFIYPSELLETVNEVANGYITSLGTKSFEKLKAGKIEEAFKERLEYDEKIITTGLYLGEKYDWQILSIFQENPDYFHHVFWNKPDLLKRYYVWLDKILGKFNDFAKSQNANLIIASDHGCGPIKKHFLVNTWLREMGFAEFGDLGFIRKKLTKTKFNRGFVRQILSKTHTRSIASRVTPKKVKMMIPIEEGETAFIDESSSQVYSDGYNCIKVNIENSEEHEKLVNKIIEELLKIEDDGNKVVEEVHKREEVFHGPYVDRAADIQFLLKRGYRWTSHIRDSHYLLEPKDFDKIRSGDHRPDGIIVGIGPDVLKGEMLEKSPMLWDITPTILHMLGLSIPDYMDGNVIKELCVNSSEPIKKEIELSDKKIKNYESQRDSKKYTKKEKDEIIKSLKEMGYL